MKKLIAILAAFVLLLAGSIAQADNFYMKKTLSQLQAMHANPGDRAIVHTDAGVVTFYAYIGGTWTEMTTFNKGGGTLFSSYAVGDLLYANTTSTLAKLADVAAGKYLRSGGVSTAPAWSTLILPNSATKGDLFFASAANTMGSIADVTAGSYLRSGGVGADPVWSTLVLPNAATKGDVLFASAANTIGALADVASGSYLRSGGVGADPVWSTVTIPNAATTGDIWYGSASNTMSALASVAAGSVLRSAGVGTAPAWSTVTIPDAAAQGDLLYASAANTWSQLTKSASASRYLSNTGTDNAPAWAQVALADGVSGTLPATNGGTGAASYAIGDILYADTTTSLAKLADVAAGSFLRSGGVNTAPAWSTLAMPNSATQGDLLYASSANTIGNLSGVAVNQVLVSGGVGAAPAYSTDPVTATHGLTTPRPTPATGTGVTVNDAGSLRTQVYKVTVAKENFVSNAVTHDLTIATLPAKSVVHSVIANVTEAFACTAVCTTATLSGTIGVSAGGTEFLASFDMDAAIAAFGDADGEVGSALNIAGNTNGGYISWAGTPIVLRATSGTGEWGSGAATNLSAGSLTFYILYSVLP